MRLTDDSGTDLRVNVSEQAGGKSDHELARIIQGQAGGSVGKRFCDKSLAGHEDVGHIKQQGPAKDQGTGIGIQTGVVHESGSTNDHGRDDDDVGGHGNAHVPQVGPQP